MTETPSIHCEVVKRPVPRNVSLASLPSNNLSSFFSFCSKLWNRSSGQQQQSCKVFNHQSFSCLYLPNISRRFTSRGTTRGAALRLCAALRRDARPRCERSFMHCTFFPESLGLILLISRVLSSPFLPASNLQHRLQTAVSASRHHEACLLDTRF